ncbi:cytochrome c oxidase assembly protein [Thiohalomonas denitrificans]|uniref:Cytochrome c oxidase assembly protein CtaG n=1 Tax=Thiohalomonas denitrificans TaxID=415747 RepID=A0A1G5PVH0_9GAMM|nr:cytochrome c oxidase assembly protein [Thiohalomonas denitrificans]SCZ53564.1 cytochrome c oxidase assembly protein subunit 11 [Thiohalomonas denitrificans]
MRDGTHKRTNLWQRSRMIAAVVGFGLVMASPLFNRLAEVQPAAGGAATEGKAIPEGRMVTVMFDSSVNDNLPWEIVPDVHSVRVPIGTTHRVGYRASNRTATAISGQAIPAVAPWQATRYFSKSECFCFTRQTLLPGETKQMPVAFRISPELPEDIDSLTLSYTFMEEDDAPAASTGIASLVRKISR